MDQRIIDLYDEFTHCHLDRRVFLERLSKLVGSTAAALLILPQLESNHALAQTVPETDARLRTQEVTYPGSTGTVKGYLARPAGDAKAAGVVVIHENRGLPPHVRGRPARFPQRHGRRPLRSGGGPPGLVADDRVLRPDAPVAESDPP